MAHVKDCAKENSFFRKAICTGESCQLEMMSIPPGGETGLESHSFNEAIFIQVKGTGRMTVNSRTRGIGHRDLVLVPAGSVYTIKNDRKGDLKLMVIYAAPVYLDGTLQETKEKAREASREAIQHAWEQ